MNPAEAILESRRRLVAAMPAPPPRAEDEGGCGVLGYIATAPTSGRFLDRPLAQMHNRGNGKGGGVCALGCFPGREDLFAVQVGYLEESSAPELDLEIRHSLLEPVYRIEDREEQPRLDDPREAGLEIRPPRIVRYFCRVREDARSTFQRAIGIESAEKAQGELVYQTSFRANSTYYAGAKPRALVLSHGRDFAIFKGVGYAEQILRYYRLEEMKAHGWIGHQRYPTRGRVWHPGGAHPFVGVDEALVHNGDFANYHAVSEYLLQRGIRPLFVTDTEVSVLLFDLLTRVYEYPLEHVIEALAPTTELDFLRLPKRKQRVYAAIRASHLHGSPDGPWFFILARNAGGKGDLELVGITDTSMLRPQVFALSEGAVSLGAVASEKQAIDAVLQDLAAEDPRICPVADRYWNARGGSSTDGGAFVFRLESRGEDGRQLVCHDKFGRRIGSERSIAAEASPVPSLADSSWGQMGRACEIRAIVEAVSTPDQVKPTFHRVRGVLRSWDETSARDLARALVDSSLRGEIHRAGGLGLLTYLRDRHYDPGRAPRARLEAIWEAAIRELFAHVPGLDQGGESGWRRIDWRTRGSLRPPRAAPVESILVIDARAFPPEGDQSVARLLVAARREGWTRFTIYDTKGDRFLGSGLGPCTSDLRIDVYGSPGDYLGSALDGATLHCHADAQDQVAQILKSGTIVVHGSVGQTLLYGAKGGKVFVRGNAGGRALINAVGGIRAVINGTCLDYAAESFMAGRPTGDGFLLINGVEFDERGNVVGMELKYPGSTFFSLASGGAGYLNDPYRTVGVKQLNGASFAEFTEEDWQVIDPVLRENEEHFGISVEGDLQTVDGVFHWPQDIFRKVVADTAA